MSDKQKTKPSEYTITKQTFDLAIKYKLHSKHLVLQNLPKTGITRGLLQQLHQPTVFEIDLFD